LLAYLVLELGSISRRVSAIAGRAARVATHESPQPLYRAAATAINESLQRGQRKKSVWIVSATGIPETLPSPPDDPTTKDYYNALTSVMRNPSWSIRILYNVDTLDRLDWIHDYLSSIKGSPDLEARALTHVDQEILAPLIIGERHVLIAQGDRRYHAVRAGIEIVDSSANDLMRSYFDSLWHDVDLVIRRPTGIDEAAFEKVRSELRSRH
jgi:hypothetical protein